MLGKPLVEYLVPPKDGPGFGINLARPGTDLIALEYAKAAFGEKNVSRVVSKLHRATISMDSIIDDFLGFDYNYAPAKRDEVYYAILESVRKDFIPKDRLLIPLTTGAATKHKDFPKDKSPGLPWRDNGYKTKGDVLNDEIAMKKIYEKWHRISEADPSMHLPDTMIFHRAQICSVEKNKIRAVFG